MRKGRGEKQEGEGASDGKEGEKGESLTELVFNEYFKLHP